MADYATLLRDHVTLTCHFGGPDLLERYLELWCQPGPWPGVSRRGQCRRRDACGLILVVSAFWIVTCSGPCRPLSAERMGELAAKPGVLVGELLVAVEGGGEPGAQRRVGGPLGGGDAAGALPRCMLPEPADLAADVGLDIEP